MKQKLFGILIMIVGCAMIAVSTALIAEATNGDSSAKSETSPQASVSEGVYLSADGAEIEISGEKILIDGKAYTFSLSVWRNIPITDEKTGKITYENYYYIRTNNSQFTYEPSANTINAFGISYTKA